MYFRTCLVVIYINIFLIPKSESGLEVIYREDVESISTCALEVAEKHFRGVPNINIFSINTSRDYDILSKLYASSRLGKKLKQFTTYEVDVNEIFRRYTVVAVHNLNEILENYDQIKKLNMWNARSKYIFVVRKNTIHLLARTVNLLWYNYFLNTVILMPSKEDKELIEIYAWFPYENGSCGLYTTAKLVDTCSHGNFSENVDLYPDKVPFNMNGCAFRTQLVWNAPYVLPPDDGIIKEGEILNMTKGQEMMLMRTVATRLNFTILPMASRNPNDWGFASVDGNATGTIKVLYEKRAEIGFGSFGPAYERRILCDYVSSQAFETLSWCVPQAQLAPRWRNILDTFQYSTWLSMIGTYFLVSCITWCFCYTQPKDVTSYVKLKNCFHNLFSIYLAVSANETPRKGSGRIIFFVWIVFGLHFVAAYQAKLITVLVNPPYERQLDSLEEILNSGMDWASLPTLRRFFNNTDDWKVAKIINEWKFEPNQLRGLARIARKRDFALFLMENNARYSSLRFIGPDFKPLIFCLASYLHFPTEIYFTKGFPLRDRIEKEIYGIQGSGLMDKWKRDVLYELKIKNIKTFEGNDDSARKLTVDHLQGAFMVYGLGISSSFIIFICENMYLVFRRKKMGKEVLNKWKHYKSTSAKRKIEVKTVRMLQNSPVTKKHDMKNKSI